MLPREYLIQSRHDSYASHMSTRSVKPTIRFTFSIFHFSGKKLFHVRYHIFTFSKLQGVEKATKRIVKIQLKAQFMQDIDAISYAWSPAAATALKELFFNKWERHENPIVVDVTNHSRTEWCSVRLGNCSCGHARNCVINTNGLEATNKVIKDELTYRQLMPVLDFLRQALVWL